MNCAQFMCIAVFAPTVLLTVDNSLSHDVCACVLRVFVIIHTHAHKIFVCVMNIARWIGNYN